jgi:hypothetical protein
MNVESLTEKTEIERLVTLKSAILKEWAANSAPSFTGLIGANGQDSQEIINYFEGRKFHELPFDDSFFCTMTPLYYLSDYSSAYYLGGYIIEAIDRSLHAIPGLEWIYRWFTVWTCCFES